MNLKNTVYSTSLALGFAISQSFASAESKAINALVEETQAAHNITAWWGKEVVQANVEVVFGGQAIVSGTFTFQAHGPFARYDRADGTSIIFDGKDAWLTPANTTAPRGRFHVLTWPWFIMAPFKIQGQGIHLSQLEERSAMGVDYTTILQRFGEGVGDTPDDWYRFYINPETQQIDMMSYIVTYGKGTEEANQKPSIIKYFDYTDAGGPLISTHYEFWFWDTEKLTVVGEKPKGTGTVTGINYLSHDPKLFEVPSDARKLELPN